MTEEQIDFIAEKTGGFSGSDLTQLLSQSSGMFQSMLLGGEQIMVKVIYEDQIYFTPYKYDEENSRESVNPNVLKIDPIELKKQGHKILPPPISFNDVKQALRAFTPKLRPEDIQAHLNYQKKLMNNK